MFTDREHEILDEHFREWFPEGAGPDGIQGGEPDREDVIDNLIDRIREEDPGQLKSELEAILTKYLGESPAPAVDEYRANLAAITSCYGCGAPGATKDAIYGYWCGQCSKLKVLR
jgi:hypothetical protein